MKDMPAMRLAAIAYGLMMCACSFRVVAPPARLGFAESPKVTQEGRTKYAAEGILGGEIFGPIIHAATLRVSKGLSGNREINFRPVLGKANEDPDFRQNNVFYGMALDMKKQLTPSEAWWAASCWGGGGYLYSSFGDVYSGQGGFAIGKESHWFRPFVSADVFIDIPARTKTIRSEYEGDAFAKRLTTTVGAKAAIGLKLQFIPEFALVWAAGLGVADSQTDNLAYLMLGQTFELEF